MSITNYHMLIGTPKSRRTTECVSLTVSEVLNEFDQADRRMFLYSDHQRADQQDGAIRSSVCTWRRAAPQSDRGLIIISITDSLGVRRPL